MTSRGQCPRGGGVLVNVFTPPPPFQEILYPRLDRDPPQKLYPISPTECTYILDPDLSVLSMNL